MSKFSKEQADRMANGLILLIFGFLLLLFQLRVTNHWFWLTYIKSPPTFFLIAGGIFLWLKRKKYFGYILTAIGVIGYSDILLKWTNNYILFSQYSFPLIVMLSGIGILLFTKR